MTKYLKNKSLMMSAAFAIGMLSESGAAYAGGEANNFGNIARNIQNSVADVPGLLSALAYLFGILLGVLGVMKIKDHVENPQQTALKDGAIRLAAGGALFALPIIYEAMAETVDKGGAVKGGATAAELNKVNFGLKGDN